MNRSQVLKKFMDSVEELASLKDMTIEEFTQWLELKDEESPPESTLNRYLVLVPSLRVRQSPGLDGVQIGNLQSGYFVIAEDNEEIVKDGWIWRQIVRVEDSDNQSVLPNLVGGWSAHIKMDYKLELMKFIRNKNTLPDLDNRKSITFLSGKDERGEYIWPDVYGTRTARNNFGGAIRELLWYGYKNPETGSTVYPFTMESMWRDFLDELSHNGVRIVRVYLAREEASETEAIERARRFIRLAYSKGILTWIVCMDSHRLGTVKFTLPSLAPWHKGPNGHLIATFWRDHIYRLTAIPFGKKAMMELRDEPGFHIWSWFNEPAIYPDPVSGETCKEQDMMTAWKELYSICEELIPDKLYGPDVVDLSTVLPSLRQMPAVIAHKTRVRILKSLPINHFSCHLFTKIDEKIIDAPFISENLNNSEPRAEKDMLACRKAGVVFSIGEIACRAIYPTNRIMILKNALFRILVGWKAYAVLQWAISRSSMDDGTLFPKGGMDPVPGFENWQFYDAEKALMLEMSQFVEENLVLHSSPVEF